VQDIFFIENCMYISSRLATTFYYDAKLQASTQA